MRAFLFDKLNDSWKIGLPEDDDTHNKYLEELCSTLKLMHSCIVVHYDLMPCNIAWKMSDGNLLLKFLDFDAATSLSFHVGSKLNTMTLTNRKDKMWKEELEPDVRFDWWYLFLYSKIPAYYRVSEPVSGKESPNKVNEKFIEWMDEKENVSDLRNEFDGWIIKQNIEELKLKFGDVTRWK